MTPLTNKQIYDKAHYEVNHDYYKTKQREYHIVNRDRINAYKREYHQANRERINAYKKEKITCEICHCQMNRASMTTHSRSIKHRINLYIEAAI